MLRLARELWPTWVGDEPMPDDPDALTRRVLDAIGQDHPKADELLDFCRAEHERIEDFIRERDLIGLADEPLQIIWTPPFLRAFGGAMLIPPGPLDKGLDSFFAITPPPEDWTDEQVTIDAAREQQPLPAGADDPRGGAGPLPPAGVVEPMRLAGARRLRLRRLRRGLGGVRDAGDDGRRLRRR